ncbi:Sorting nexin, cytoplasm-to-vacuole targeting pathway/endosomal sorting [Coemansia sp. RSA 2711]|nr:Sorting nexin, cytoplasm-to-vacuole targeting pathway/endosomal sorting [Coemansia sp. RSA 2711]
MGDVGDYCCGIDRHLHELLDDARAQRQRDERQGTYQAPQAGYVVHVGEAEKLSEGGTSFIAYTVTFGDSEVRRRYSEFESLRGCLGRLYPTFIVPPIPEKHSLAQYAALQKRAKEDQHIIGRRKRMLEHFLNHVALHPILSSEHIFHRFLESGVSWTEVLHSPVVTGLPRTPLHSSPSRAPGSSVADSAPQLPKIAATNALAADVPVPSALAPIRNVEARWMDCELFTNKYAQHFSGTIERNERRMYRRLGELAGDYAELGATLNGFSLLGHADALAAAIERAGQAMDSSYIELGELLTQMEAEVGEPIHAYAQYGAVIKQVLRFRLLKNLQLEGVEEALANQRAKLERLLQADDEARRLAQALEAAPNSAAETTVAADAESLLSDASQPRGFATPRRASTDVSSAHGAARSRGPSVSSGAHAEFTPTLAPRSIPDDPALHVAAAHKAPEDDDPLAQFQQEESQLWGGGAGSTLPRLGGRSRGQTRTQADGVHAQSEHIGHAQSEHTGHAQSEHIGHAQSEYIGHAHAFGASSGKLAASTPALWDTQPQPPAPALATTAAAPAPAAPNASLGVRLLRSPKALGDGLMNRLTYALNGMMDVDPEQMRHNQIGRASDKIGVLEEQLEMLSNDMALINTSTQDNLDRFQKQKVRDLKGVLIAMARMHLEWAEKNLEIWRDAKVAVDEV